MKPDIYYDIEVRREMYMIDHYNRQISESESKDLSEPGSYLIYTFPMNQYSWKIERRFDQLLKTYCVDITIQDPSSMIIDKISINYIVFRNFIIQLLNFMYISTSDFSSIPFNFCLNCNGYMYLIKLEYIDIKDNEVEFKESISFDMISGCLRDKEFSIYKKELLNDITVPIMRVNMSIADITDISIIMNNVINRLDESENNEIIDELIGYMMDSSTIPFY